MVTVAAIAVAVALAAVAAKLLAKRGDADGAAEMRSSCATIELEPAPPETCGEAEIRWGGAVLGRPEPRQVPLVGGRARVDLTDGRPARAYVACGDGIVWPRSAGLVVGRTASFRLEPLRTIVLGADQDPGDSADAPPRVRFIPDRSVIPDGPAARVDALQAWIDTECVVVRRRAGSVEARVPPGTAWWVLAQLPGGPVISHVPAADAVRGTARAVGLLAPSVRRTLRRAPTIDGGPIPDGTLVVPGRLDVFAVGAVRAAVRDIGFAGAVVVGLGGWRAVDLPTADELTLAHASFGVAYAAWPDSESPDAGPPNASSESGAIEFVAGAGAEFSLGVAVWPAWPGTGDVFSRPSDRMLRTIAIGGTSHVVRGLPSGAYRFDYAASSGAGRPGTRLRRGAVLVDAAGPRPRVEVTLTTE